MVACRAWARSPRRRRTSVLSDVEGGQKVCVAAFSPRAVARCRCLAGAAVGAEVANRVDSPAALAFVRDHVISLDDMADRLAAGFGADGSARIYVRACGLVDGALVPRKGVAAPAGLRGRRGVRHGAFE